jgi:hypothetical protein
MPSRIATITLISDGTQYFVFLSMLRLVVWSRHFMGWIESKNVWGLSPDFAEVFVGLKASKAIESSGEVVCSEEVCRVLFERLMGVVRSVG